MWLRRIERRLGPCEVLGIAIVRGFSLRFHKRGRDGSGKCDAYHTGDITDTLYGVVYSLSQYQRDMLDELEGPGYASREVPVRTRSGILTAYTYVAKPEHLHSELRPFVWYKSIVVAGARAHALPAAYVERLAAVHAVPDPDGARHARHQAILDETVGVVGDD